MSLGERRFLLLTDGANTRGGATYNNYRSRSRAMDGGKIIKEEGKMTDRRTSDTQRCYACGEKGHIEMACLVGKKCYTCGEAGHIKVECPMRRESGGDTRDKGQATAGEGRARENGGGTGDRGEQERKNKAIISSAPRSATSMLQEMFPTPGDI